jgi:hypothetical protein
MALDAGELAKRFLRGPSASVEDVSIRREVDEVQGWIHQAARAVVDATPPCREQSVAMTKLEEASFWATAAVEREG